jgi:hypothetical protein
MISNGSVTLNGTNGLVNVVETNYEDICCDAGAIAYNGVGYELIINDATNVSAFGVTNNGVGWVPETELVSWRAKYLSQQEWDNGTAFIYESVNTYTSDLGSFASLFGTEDESVVLFYNFGSSTFRRNSSNVVRKHDFRLTTGAVAYSEFSAFSGGVVISSSLTTVSEPATLAIFGLALIGLASRRFKNQS